jgi:hypothetical protein
MGWGREDGPFPPVQGESEGPGAREPSAHGLDSWGREGELGEAARPGSGSPLTLPSPPAGGGEGRAPVE